MLSPFSNCLENTYVRACLCADMHEDKYTDRREKMLLITWERSG